MPFSAVFDLAPAVSALRRALERDQLAGTYLLVGAQGVGKTTLARAFAEAAACLDPQRDPFDACGRCESCRRAAAGTQPEIVLVSPAGDQTQIWQFWDRDGRSPGVLQHTLTFAPVVGRRRVYLVERADTLTEPAANSLLKVLEEPPPYAVFVLLAPHAGRMLATVLSRSQIVRLHPGPVDALGSWMAAEHGIEPGRARRYAAYAQGLPGAALRLARSPAAEEELGRALDFAESISVSPPLRAPKVADTMRKLAAGLKALAGEDTPAAEPAEDSGDAAPKERAGRRQLAIVFELLIAVYRDVLALSLAGAEAAAVVHTDRRAALQAVADRGHSSRWMRCLEALLAARRCLDQNVNVTLLTDHLAAQLVIDRGVTTCPP